MRKLSPSMIVGLVALFVALSGVAVAANGGNFILGHANNTTLRTGLSAPVAGGKALQVTNIDTSNAASTALGLTVASGHAPFTVNSAVKVANLNADTLDGLDSTLLQRRVTGTCASGDAIQAVAANGTVACQSFVTVSGKAADADQLDGIDSSGFWHGSGHSAEQSHSVPAGSQAALFFSPTLQGPLANYWVLGDCANANAPGGIRVALGSYASETAQVWVEAGGSAPTYTTFTTGAGSDFAPGPVAAMVGNPVQRVTFHVLRPGGGVITITVWDRGTSGGGCVFTAEGTQSP